MLWPDGKWLNISRQYENQNNLMKQYKENSNPVAYGRYSNASRLYVYCFLLCRGLLNNACKYFIIMSLTSSWSQAPLFEKETELKLDCEIAELELEKAEKINPGPWAVLSRYVAAACLQIKPIY